MVFPELTGKDGSEGNRPTHQDCVPISSGGLYSHFRVSASFAHCALQLLMPLYYCDCGVSRVLRLSSFTCAEAQQFQYHKHLSDCSVQSVNEARNTERTA